MYSDRVWVTSLEHCAGAGTGVAGGETNLAQHLAGEGRNAGRGVGGSLQFLVVSRASPLGNRTVNPLRFFACCWCFLQALFHVHWGALGEMSFLGCPLAADLDWCKVVGDRLVLLHHAVRASFRLGSWTDKACLPVSLHFGLHPGLVLWIIHVVPGQLRGASGMSLMSSYRWCLQFWWWY